MAAFGLGDNDRMIGFADAQGVAFAAIQGLNAKLEEREIALRREVKTKDTEIAGLRKRVAQLEASDKQVAALDRDVAQLRRAVEILLTRTSPEGRMAEAR